MRDILIGTHNRHKAEELRQLLLGLPLKVRDLTEFPDIKAVEENGKTLLENSVKKANTYGEMTNLPCLADDTGLEVEALNGEPGIFSARYAGEHCSYQDNCEKLLWELKGETNRKAVFKTVVAFYDPQVGAVETAEGVVKGEIVKSPSGKNGFGYDPIFYIPELKKTYAELSLEEKNRISHRARAVQNMKHWLANKYFKVNA